MDQFYILETIVAMYEALSCLSVLDKLEMQVVTRLCPKSFRINALSYLADVNLPYKKLSIPLVVFVCKSPCCITGINSTYVLNY